MSRDTGSVYRVLHVDLDQFIAAVEMLRRPELAGRPVVVGGHGDPTRRGVVATANYAAREHGIRSGMPLRTAARRCPDAVFLPADNAAYEAASDEVMAVLRSFGPTDGAVVEVLGWDEAFMGFTTDDAVDVAQRIRDEVHTRTRLTCCVGIGDNLLRAKIATAFAKPPVRSEAGHPAGTGRVHAHREELGRGNGRPADPSAVGNRREDGSEARRAGPAHGPRAGRRRPDRARGGPGARARPVVRATRAGRRAGSWSAASRGWPAPAGTRRPLPTDLTDWAEVRSAAAGLARRVAADVTAEGRPAARVGVTVRFAPFTTRTRSATLSEPDQRRGRDRGCGAGRAGPVHAGATGPAGGRPGGVRGGGGARMTLTRRP